MIRGKSEEQDPHHYHIPNPHTTNGENTKQHGQKKPHTWKSTTTTTATATTSPTYSGHDDYANVPNPYRHQHHVSILRHVIVRAIQQANCSIVNFRKPATLLSP